MNGFVSTAYIIIISILCFTLAFLLTVAVLNSTFREKLLIQKRLNKFISKESKNEVSFSKTKTDKKKKKYTGKLKLSQTIATELQTAGIPIRTEEFAIIWILSAFLPSGLIGLATGNIIIASILVVAGIIVPPSYVKKQKKKKVVAFENQLGDALVTMCNCLRSGLTLAQAFENISTEMEEPISKEFKRLCTEIKYGTPLEKALNAMTDRIGSDDLVLMVSAINIQRQVGGNLSEILSSISETIKARVKLKGEIKVLTATGRVSGIIIGCLPVFLGLIITLLNPDYMVEFVSTGVGKILLGVGVVMEIMGFLVIKKILAIKY